jgi:hypothetical protein
MNELKLAMPPSFKLGSLKKDIQNKEQYAEYIIARILLITPKFQQMIDSAKSEKEFAVKKICKTFQLTPNWQESISEAIDTGILHVPHPYHSIQIYHPLIGNPYYKLNHTDYPGIFFTHKVSFTELQNWINENKKNIQVLLQELPNLPSINKTRVKPKTLLLGYLSMFADHEGKKTYKEKSDFLIGKILYSNDEELIELLSDSISENTLRNGYQQLSKLLRKLP